MNILVIDDERTFDVYKFHPDWTTYARTLVEARRIYDQRWDIVYLDHDLGSGENVSDLTRIWERVAHHGTLLDVGKFIIHSMNPLGRKEMYEALHKFYNVEFARVEDLL